MKTKIFTLLLALVSLAANAAVIQITPTFPEPADNLRLALERAQTGDTIEMAEGTYVESNGDFISFSGKEVTVRAAGEVLLQAQVPITISDGGKAELIGIQIDASHLNDLADWFEHVIYASNADANNRLVMKDCVLKNFLPNSSAIYCSASNKLASIEIDGCYIHDIMKSVILIESTDSTNLTVTNSTIANVVTNTESYYAGVIDSRATKGDVLVDHCTFYNAIPMNTDYGAIGKIKTAGNKLVSNSIFMLPEVKDGIRCIRDAKEAKNCLVFNYIKDSNWGIHSSVTKTDCINDQDPLFKDAANGDFMLLEGSPALTAGEGGGPIGAPRWYSNISYGFDSKMGFVEGPIWAQKNTTISFVAIPGYGYHFIQWSDGITDNPRTVEFTQDTTFTAEFAQNPTITYVYDALMGIVEGPTGAQENTTISFEAIPRYGYHFSQWSDGITDNPRTIEFTRDTTFTAEFAKNSYTITTESSNPEWGTTAGDTSALYLEKVQIIANPNYGYHFAQWNESASIPENSITAAEATSITLSLNQNTETSIQYMVVGYIVGNYRTYDNSYYLADTPNGEPVFVIYRANQSADIGDRVIITGYLRNYYGMPEVRQGGELQVLAHYADTYTNPLEITVIKDTTYQAVFAKNTYSITKVFNSEQGSIDGVSQAEFLDSILLTAIPNYGYHFSQWSDGVTDNPRTAEITMDTTFTAEFERNKYTITTSSSNPEWGTTSGDTTVFYLDSVEISATPNYGYYLSDWYVELEGTTYYINNSSSYSIVARFSVPDSWPDPYAWIWTSGQYNGSWVKLPKENGLYVYRTNDANKGIIMVPDGGNWTGQTEDIYLTESACYTIEDNGGVNYPNITKSYDCITENSNNYLLRVEGNTTVTAVFAQNIYSITKIANYEQGYISGYSQAGYLDSVTLEAIPNVGYHFAQWSDGVTDNPRTIELTQDTTFTAEFAKSYSGQCGDELFWSYEDQMLTFSGSGDMYYYSSYTQPWIFFRDSISQIVSPAEMTSVSNYAFYGFNNLVSYEGPAVALSVLPQNKLKSVIINGGLITDYNFNNALTRLDMAAADNTSLPASLLNGFIDLKELTLPSQLELIDYMTVAGCLELKEIVIPASVTAIERRAFEDCRSLSSLTFEEGSLLTTIGAWAFYNCHELANIDIPEGVTEIGKAAFYGCTYAQAAHLPASVQSIGDNAFALCSKLTQMDVDAVLPPEVEDKTFYEVSTEAPVYVPEESVDMYKSHAVWGKLNIVGKSNIPQGIGETQGEKVQCTKILRDGQIFILRGGKVYTVTGQKVK